MSIYFQNKRPRKRLKWVLLVFVLAVLVFLLKGDVANEVKEAVSQSTILSKNEEAKEQAEKKETARLAREQKKEQLKAALQTQLSVNERYAVGVYDINNTEEFGVNESTQFHAASVMKLLVATTAFRDIEAGKYSLSSTVRGHLQQMINQSNNNSWEYFNQLQGFDHQQEVADQLGLSGIKVWGNQMSPQGVNQLLLKLYKGEVLTEEHRKLFFSFMQNTETENRISPSIPVGVSFYHKTGTFEGGVHDAAIVIHPKNPFILTIFTNDSKGTPWETRFKSIQEASAAVYNYFNEI